jgi:hypothetical protein
MSKEAMTNNMTNANNTTNDQITMDVMIHGINKSMRLGDIINVFIDLLVSNDPREDFPCTLYTGTHAFPEFCKVKFVSSQVFQMINNPFNEMVISMDGHEILKTSDIDMMYIGLAKYNAYVEDTMDTNGFCWVYNDNHMVAKLV